MGYNEISNYISENPGTSFILGVAATGVIVLARNTLSGLLRGKTYRSYPEPDRNDRRMGNGGAGMPYYGNDDDFAVMQQELKEQAGKNR